MPRELFRTTFIQRDSRLIKVYVTCQYCIASLFLGMFLVLSGIMITSYAENYRKDDLTEEQLQQKTRNSQIFGSIIMIAGLVLLVMAVILFFFSALLFMRTTTHPPSDNQWISMYNEDEEGTQRSGQRDTRPTDARELNDSSDDIEDGTDVDHRIRDKL